MRAAELLAEDFAEVGIDVAVDPLDAGSVSDASAKKNYDLFITTNSPHAVADSTQFIMSHRSGNLWKHPDLAYPEFDALYDAWKVTETNDDRIAAMQDMQRLFNRQPTAIALYYPPDEFWAFRADTFGGWVETPGLRHRPQVVVPAGGRRRGGERGSTAGLTPACESRAERGGSTPSCCGRR